MAKIDDKAITEIVRVDITTGNRALTKALVSSGADMIANSRQIRACSADDRFRLAFEFSNVAIGMVDLDGNILEANESLANLLGFSVEALRLTNLEDLWAPVQQGQALADFNESIKKEQLKCVVERSLVKKNGEILLAEVTRGLLRNRDGKPFCFTFSIRDITETKRLQNLLEEQASTDPLTGAMNRIRIEERARFELMRSDRYGNKLSLLMIDLDHFKKVNDTYGHSAGDKVLKGFCGIARDLLRSIDILGRWGGEEFVALLPETSLAGAKIVAERLRSTIESSEFDNRIRVTASIGVACHREDEEFASILGRADACLYKAKLGGRNRVVIDAEDIEYEAASEQASPVLLKLHWRPSYLCGDPAIDSEHQDLFRLANRIIAKVTEETGGPEALSMFRELITHLRAHFAHEEQSLMAAGFPGTAEHLAIHRDLDARACEVADKLERGEGQDVYLLRFLIHEIVAKHMLQEDRKFFNLFHAQQA
jgi:diguanylate cyclase (GGDEF)-like protein/hemerythrin-like metal-binding protein/PAS domain S-box-containing protein